MQNQTVIVTCDVDIRYTGEYPVYRLYVGNELFTERTWIWTDEFLREKIVLEAPYGLYPIQYELLPHPDAVIKIKNATVTTGPGRFRKHLALEIHDENL
jgi:hypothetical protein